MACLDETVGIKIFTHALKTRKKNRNKEANTYKDMQQIIQDRLQLKLSWIQIIRVLEFLEKIYSDPGGPYPLTCWEQKYYISFWDYTTTTYLIKTMLYKSQAFKRFLAFISWKKNQPEKKLKRYHIDKREEFDNKALKS